MKIRNKLQQSVYIMLLLVMGVSTHAASITLGPADIFAAPGDTVTLTLVADFSDRPAIGGGLDIFYDASMLEFVSFTFDANLNDDPDLRRNPDDDPGELNGIGFGLFSGFSGQFVIGQLSFVVLDLGTSQISMMMNEGGLGPYPNGPANPGGFIDTVGGLFTSADLTFNGSQITATTIPIPAAFYLLLSAVLMTLKRRT